MSQDNTDETYTVIYTALKHPIRRKILRMLNNEELTYTEMLEKLGLDTGHLNYYLESLGELIKKTPEAKYRLSEFGQAAIGLMNKVEETSQDKKEIVKLRTSKRRIVLMIQTVAIVALLASSLVFFNISYQLTYPGGTMTNGENVLQPNEIAVQFGYVSLGSFNRVNSSTVQYKIYYGIDVTTNASVWIQLLGGIGDISNRTSMNEIPQGASLLFNQTRGENNGEYIGLSSKVTYHILVPISPNEPGYNYGFRGSSYVVRVADLGRAWMSNNSKFELIYNNSASVKIVSSNPFIEETDHPYYYFGVTFLFVAIVTALLPYLPMIKFLLKKSAKM
jgi:hypothetical protein